MRGRGCCHSSSFPCCCPCEPGAGASPMDSHSQPRGWVGFPSPDRQAVCRGGGLAQARRGMGSATRLGPHPIGPHAVLLTGRPQEQPLPIRKSDWGEHQSISAEESSCRTFISPTLRTRSKMAPPLLSGEGEAGGV